MRKKNNELTVPPKHVRRAEFYKRINQAVKNDISKNKGIITQIPASNKVEKER